MLVNAFNVYIDEIAPIANYMANEMRINSSSKLVNDIKRLNSFNFKNCLANSSDLPELIKIGVSYKICSDLSITNKTAALLLWAVQVREGGNWDHKGIIAQKFRPMRIGSSAYWHLHESKEYFYDVWSNIHYGYVGKAAGFSDAELLKGAGLEQIGGHLFTFLGSWGSCLKNGLAACDDPSDRIGIEKGIELFRNPAGPLNSSTLIRLVTETRGITSRDLTISRQPVPNSSLYGPGWVFEDIYPW